MILIIAAVASLLLGIVSMGLSGVYCGVILSVITLGPIVGGTICGLLLRSILKFTPFSQRWYLPVLVIVLIPPALLLLQGPRPQLKYESISTSTIINVPPPVAWERMIFYEQVTHEPPLLLRLGLPDPLSTTGTAQEVGDRKVCLYTKGRLIKEVTAVVPQQRLDFRIVEQSIGLEHDVRLTGGSFEFQSHSADRTRVSLTTEYEPLLHPRWLWRPFERVTVHALHGHVLKGMQQKSPRSQPIVAMERTNANQH